MLLVSEVDLRFLRQKCLAPYWRKKEVKEFCNVRLANEAKMVAPVTRTAPFRRKMPQLTT